MIGLNVYGMSLFDMQRGYIRKYGNIAAEAQDETFFKSTYDFYDDVNLLDVSVVPTDESELGFNLQIFQAVAGKRNFLRIQMDHIVGYKRNVALMANIYLEGGRMKQIEIYTIKSTDLFSFGAVDLKTLYKPDGESEFYYDIVDVKIFAYGKLDDGTETKVELYDFDGDMFLSKVDMQLAEELATPLDPNAEVKTYPTPESLGLTKGVQHNYFAEYQWMMWRNMSIYVFIMAIIAYLIFFKKKKTNVSFKQGPSQFVENLNIKTIEEVKAIDKPDSK